MTYGLPVVVLTCSILLHLSSTYANSWRLSITPPEVVTIFHGESMTIFCQTRPPVALADCGFQIALPMPNEPLYVDADRPVAENWNLTAKYDGKKLSEGRCQLQLTASPLYKEETFPVGCRVRAVGGGWEYNYTSIIDTAWLPKEISLRTEPDTPYHVPGSSLIVHCDSAKKNPLKKCSFTLPGKEKFDLSLKENNGVYQYVGEGLDKHQCGILIPNITEAVSDDNDVISCETFITYRQIPTRELQVNTARCASDHIGLEVSSITPGNTTEKAVQLRCITPSCRAPATISWFLDDVPISSGIVTEEPVEEWRWQRDMQTTTQVLVMDYVPGIEGLTVKCAVEHATFKAHKSVVIPSPDASWPWWLVVIVVVTSLLIIAAAIASFAKCTNRWCFHQERKSNSRSQAGSEKRGEIADEERPMSEQSH